MITIYDHDHYDSCSSSNWDSGSGCAASLRCEVLGTTVACRRKKKFLSESCLRRQPEHPLDRSACGASHTIKNLFLRDQLCWISVRMPNFAEVWHPSAIANAIRVIDRSLNSDRSLHCFPSSESSERIMFCMSLILVCRCVFTKTPKKPPNSLFFNPKNCGVVCCVKLGCPEFGVLCFQNYEIRIFLEKKYEFRSFAKHKTAKFRNSVFSEL